MKKLILLLILILAACSCSDNEAAPTSETGDTTVSSTAGQPAVLRLAVLSHQEDAYRHLVGAFTEENPDIRVELVLIDRLLDLENVAAWPDDTQQRIATNADVISFATDPSAVQQGLRLDLTSFLQQEGFDAADFYPGLLEQYQWNGGAWAMPIVVHFDLVAYNKTLFDRAGLPYPEAGWTWDDFLTTAQALTLRDEVGEVTQWGYVDERIPVGDMPPGLTGPLLAPGSDPPQPRLDNPDFIAGVQWYTDLFRAHQVAPYDQDAEEGGFLIASRDLINGNRAAMWKEQASLLIPYPHGTNWGVVPFPGLSPMRAEGLAISAGTPQPQAAWRLLDFLSRQPLLNSSAGSPYSLPARRSVTQAGNVYERLEPEMAAALRFAAEHAYPQPTGPGVAEVQEVLATAVNAILAGEQPVDLALAEAQSQAENAVSDALAALGDAPPPADFVVAPPDGPVVAANDDAVTITYAPIGGGLQREVVETLAQDFMTAHPDIAIRLEPSEFSQANTMGNVAATADCFEWRWPFDSQEAQAATLSLEPFLDANASISKEDFYPALVTQFSVEGQLLGLPGETSVDVIGYNKDFFDAAGVPYPAPDWTTEEFLEKAVALTQAAGDNKQYGYLPHLNEELDFFNWMHWLAPALVDDSINPPRLRLDDPTTIAAARWHTALTTDYGVKPLLIGEGSSGVTEWWAIRGNQQMAMWLEFSLVNATDRFRDLSESIGYVPIPAAPDGTRYSGGGGFQVARGYFISASSKPESRPACWQWITVLTEQFYGEGDIGVMPARRDVADTIYRQTVGDERADTAITFLESLEPPQAAYYRWLQPYHWLESAYRQILLEGVTVEFALAQAQARFDAYRNCVIDRDAFSDYGIQQACLEAEE